MNRLLFKYRGVCHTLLLTYHDNIDGGTYLGEKEYKIQYAVLYSV